MYVTILVSVNIMVVDNSWMKEVDICRSCQSTFPTFQQTIAPGGGQDGQKYSKCPPQPCSCVHPTTSFESIISYNIVLFKAADHTFAKG